MARPANSSKQTRVLFESLLRAPRSWRYGYDLSQETEIQSGTLYPLLIRLSDQGLLEAKWEEAERPGRPPRHIYRLTGKGLTLARELQSFGSNLILSPKPGGSAS